ncbi:MAG: glycoside hydrolase family 3 C-terminal domain-containing protein [Paludibacteraceae bacterium]|nr:glycoside hydrolase family 3 C-terminal domain-containing protein [Paludibacteraceae bacterium]
MKHFSLLLAALCSLFLAPCSLRAQSEQQIEDILSRMTLDEKIAVIHAQSKFSSPGVPRLGIPGLWCSDGPHGVRAEVLWDEWNQAGWTSDSCVAFPALTCLAATWNPEMSRLYGENLAEEALYRGKNVMLAPGVNIFRTPLNGRNFEYMGEDPYLASRMVVPYIQGVQSKGVAACVKHFALNNQETYRHLVDVKVSDRALYEIYLPAFKAAVTEAGVWSIMGSYNRYKGQYNCHNEYLLNDILRGEWGFDGAVISDWGGCQETPQAITNGLDLEFGTWTDGLTMGTTNSYDIYYLANPYKKLIQEGKVGTEELDNKVRNVLRLILRTSMNPNRGFGSLHSDEHYAAARKIATEGIVLLKNDVAKDKQPLLPIVGYVDEEEKVFNHKKPVETILVVGENAILPMTIGGGSSSLKVQREISPLQGISERAAKDGIEVYYSRGYVGVERLEQDNMSVDMSEEKYDYENGEDPKEEMLFLARACDVVIFIGGLNKDGHQDCEGVDRKEYELPYGQNELIEALYKANPNLVVVNISGTAVAMPWAKKVPAIVQAWYLGSEAGHAIADVLFGDVNPSGKLPFSIMEKLTDYPAHQYGELGYPGIPDPNAEGKFYEEYKEDIFVGYRYADKAKVKPIFPFGHGLSYTSFAYFVWYEDNADGTKTVKITVVNECKVAGSEVVQMYVGEDKPTVPRPVKELKAFQKVYLEPGESKTLTFTLDPKDWGYWDEDEHTFVTNPGYYTVYFGSSSRNIFWRYRRYYSLGKDY